MLLRILKRKDLNRFDEFLKVLAAHQLLAGPARHLDVSVVAQDQPPHTGLGVLPGDVDPVGGMLQDTVEQLGPFLKRFYGLFASGDVSGAARYALQVPFGVAHRGARPANPPDSPVGPDNPKLHAEPVALGEFLTRRLQARKVLGMNQIRQGALGLINLLRRDPEKVLERGTEVNNLHGAGLGNPKDVLDRLGDQAESLLGPAQRLLRLSPGGYVAVYGHHQPLPLGDDADDGCDVLAIVLLSVGSDPGAQACARLVWRKLLLNVSLRKLDLLFEDAKVLGGHQLLARSAAHLDEPVVAHSGPPGPRDGVELGKADPVGRVLQ